LKGGSLLPLFRLGLARAAGKQASGEGKRQQAAALQSARCRAQKLEFGLAQRGEAGLCPTLEVVNRSPVTLRHHRHLFQQEL